MILNTVADIGFLILTFGFIYQAIDSWTWMKISKYHTKGFRNLFFISCFFIGLNIGYLISRLV